MKTLDERIAEVMIRKAILRGLLEEEEEKKEDKICKMVIYALIIEFFILTSVYFI